MPNLKSSIKDLKQSKMRHLRNVATKSAIKTYSRRAQEAAEQGDSNLAISLMRRAVSTLDKAVKRGILHRNTAARRKSRLMIALNKRLIQMKDGGTHDE